MILDFDVTDAVNRQTEIAHFEHANRKISPAYIIAPASPEEGVALNILFYIVNLLPYVEGNYLSDIFRDTFTVTNNSLITISIEFYKSHEDFFLSRYTCAFNADGFWKQSLLQKKNVDVKSPWVEVSSYNRLTDKTILKEIQFPNVSFFDSRVNPVDSPQANIFNVVANTKSSTLYPILRQVETIITSRPDPVTSQSAKDLLINVLRCFGYKEALSNQHPIDLDIDSDGFIRIYSPRRENGVRLFSYEGDKIKKFLLAGAVTTLLHMTNQFLLIDRVDTVFTMPALRKLFGMLTDSKTNRLKSQILVVVEDENKIAQITKLMSERPQHTPLTFSSWPDK